MTNNPKDFSTTSMDTLNISETKLREAIGYFTPKNTTVQKYSLLIFSRDGARAVPLLAGQSVVVGRSDAADVSVRDASLSRQHASLELVEGDVWVDDLQSKNGTWVNGSKIVRSQLCVGDTLSIGAVTASLHIMEDFEKSQLDAENHDSFRTILDTEVYRARAFGRSLALMMLARGETEENGVSHWFAHIRKFRRRIDRVAWYSGDTVEILMPETTLENAKKVAAEIMEGVGSTYCGIGIAPDHASSTEELIEVTRKALRDAATLAPVQIATPATLSSREDGEDGNSQDLVIASKAMKNIYKTATRLASSSIPVLILGETGTGKEIVARMIQQASERRDGPMICINCGGIPSQLVESTLFGHERGAFTGAHRQAQGVFESANNGTVFLDEIGELPLPAQAALLRVLETSRFSRVGSNKEVETDVRVLAATNQGLEDMCQAGAFRKDLLYRLNTMTIEIPLLRDRPEDIGPLTMNFIEKANQANNCSITHIDKAAMKLLMAYSWPGNVRELRNTIERAVVISEHNIITEADLTERIRKSDSVTPPSPAPGKKRPTAGNLVPDYEINLKSELRQYEAELILNALNVVDWDRGEAAKKLGLPIRTLSHKIQSLGIKR